MSPEENIETASIDTEAVIHGITEFVAEQTGTRPEVDQDLFVSGIANSMFAMQLVVFLEQTYSVMVGGADLQLPNFCTVKSMAALVGRLHAEATANCDV
ncbi:acyl carrier protein [Nocardia sp. NPDC049149]|uniref:acyl carrier protein n=1 Tax=Nocardia sp. NPDC049149 TaxID=3364315 RepID=UPI003720E72D